MARHIPSEIVLGPKGNLIILHDIGGIEIVSAKSLTVRGDKGHLHLSGQEEDCVTFFVGGHPKVDEISLVAANGYGAVVGVASWD